MTISLYAIAFVALIFSFAKSRENTVLALKKAWKAFENILPQFLSILIIIGVILAVCDIYFRPLESWECVLSVDENTSI
ncbi:UNVERIFIED_CONTAM: hypothetical protein Cloal_2118 [Acetivibrio alkalicellulosi]